jgi:SAM-dependent methyltransferase/uncharacterized protein YbaR (Trm112 family)
MTSSAARRISRLHSLLACPRCHGPLYTQRPTVVDDVLVDGDLECGGCGSVGVVRTYRPSFLGADLGNDWSPAGLAERSIDLCAVERFGTWLVHGDGMLGTEVGACLTGESRHGIIADFGTNAWGGSIAVSLGTRTEELDLYSRDPGMARCTLEEPGDGAVHRWSIVLRPGRSAARGGDQAPVHRISELVPADQAPPVEHVPVNRGNPYPPRFDQLLSTLGESAVVLDIGGGDRRHRDLRVSNFEYLKYPAADVFGDGLCLPFASHSVDLVLSQAVLEHVPDPQRAVDELRRILRPGGRIYAEFAFMQPLHAVPWHFFNITPHGASLLFDGWEIVDLGWFGGLRTTMDWILRLVDAEQRIGTSDVEAILSRLERLDALLPDDALQYAASAVYVEALTPGDPPAG